MRHTAERCDEEALLFSSHCSAVGRVFQRSALILLGEWDTAPHSEEE